MKGYDMADEVQPLSDEERAELEALRAEKAARERAELEELRRQRTDPATVSAASAGQQRPQMRRRVEDEEDRRIREQRERGAKMMEPDDDLRMPIGQKIVLAVLAALVVIVVAMNFLVG